MRPTPVTGSSERQMEQARARIQEGQFDGSITSSISATLAAKIFIAVLDGLQVQWLLDPAHTDTIEVLSNGFWSQLLAAKDGDPCSPASSL